MASLYVLPHFVHLLLYMLAWLSVWLLAAACRERLRSLCLREAPPRGESSCVSIRMGWGSLPVASGLTGAVSYPTVDVFDYSGFCLWRGKLGAIEVTGQTERHVLSNARAPELVGLRAVKAILVMTRLVSGIIRGGSGCCGSAMASWWKHSWRYQIATRLERQWVSCVQGFTTRPHMVRIRAF
jgi:hypothetical protein